MRLRAVRGERHHDAVEAHALSTAFMLMEVGATDALCGSTAGLEAWLLCEPAVVGGEEAARLQHVAGTGPGYTPSLP